VIVLIVIVPNDMNRRNAHQFPFVSPFFVMLIIFDRRSLFGQALLCFITNVLLLVGIFHDMKVTCDDDGGEKLLVWSYAQFSLQTAIIIGAFWIRKLLPTEQDRESQIRFQVRKK
jgi:hypothetical protein